MEVLQKDPLRPISGPGTFHLEASLFYTEPAFLGPWRNSSIQYRKRNNCSHRRGFQGPGTHHFCSYLTGQFTTTRGVGKMNYLGISEEEEMLPSISLLSCNQSSRILIGHNGGPSTRTYSSTPNIGYILCIRHSVGTPMDKTTKANSSFSE